MARPASAAAVSAAWGRGVPASAKRLAPALALLAAVASGRQAAWAFAVCLAALPRQLAPHVPAAASRMQAQEVLQEAQVPGPPAGCGAAPEQRSAAGL